MANVVNRLQEKNVLQRSIIFSLALILVIAFCTIHGIKAKEMKICLLDQMIENANLAGKFWIVIRSQNNQITVTKFQRTVNFAFTPQADVQVGDRISFNATLVNPNGQSGPLWQPTKVRFHGTRHWKYWISGISVLLVLMMCLKNFRFDMNTLSLTFRKRED